MPSRAVVILANDKVYDWLAACLASLRSVSPEIPCLILPFDNRLRRTGKLAARHGASLVRPPQLERLQALGDRFCPTSRTAQHVFRKLAVFLVGIDTVLFVDADIVLLKPVEPIFDAIEDSEYDFLFADSDVERVYSDAGYRQKMVHDFAAKGANTGFWAARGGLFTLADFERLADSAEQVKCHFDPRTMEQPFLNYCLDVTQARYDHLSRVIKDFPKCSWAALPARRCGKEWFCSEQYNDSSVPLHMMHWAGLGMGWEMPNRSIFLAALRSDRGRVGALPLQLVWLLDRLRSRLAAGLGRSRIRRALSLMLGRGSDPGPLRR